MSSSRARMLSDLRKSSEALAGVKEAEIRAIVEFRDHAETKISTTARPSERELERSKVIQRIGQATRRSATEVKQLLAIADADQNNRSLRRSTSHTDTTRPGA